MKKNNKPFIYQGKRIPLDELSSNDFVNFTHGLLKVLFEHKNITLSGQPDGSGDGGFDIEARNENNEIICIQCKQYPSTTLGINNVSNELAKVALRSYVEKSTIAEHYIITTGKITQEVDSSKRETTRDKLIKHAKIEVNKEENFKNDKEKIAKLVANESLDSIVQHYILNLNKIHIWSGSFLSSEINTVYSKLSDLLERYFQIENVLREHPRPDFHENIYLNKFSDNRNYINLFYSHEKQPDNIISESKSDNYQEDIERQCSNISDLKYLKLQYDNLIANNRNFILLIGEGGSGKTTTCKQIFKYFASNRQDNKEIELPIYLSFDKCGENINNSINQELNIKYGTWQSIPSLFLLIFDGLNEIDQFKRKDLMTQINNIINNLSGRIKVIIASRNISAFNSTIIIPFIQNGNTFIIENLNNNQIDELIGINFDKTKKKEFILEFNHKISLMNQFFIQHPFGLQLLINYYKSFNYIPNTIDLVISQYYEKRYDRNKEYFISRNSSLENLPYSSFLSYIEQLAYLWRIKYKSHYLHKDESYKIITESLEDIKQHKKFGFSSLAENDIFELLIKNEILVEENNYIYFQHDIFADYFASKKFASSWDKDFIIQEKPSKEFLYFASFNINNDKIKFIEVIKNLSIGLMARCSMQMGEEIIKYTESYIEDKLNLEDKFDAITFFEAISILKTPKLKEKLKKISLLLPLNSEYNHDLIFQAKKFLCIMGDEFTLNSIVDEVEKNRLFPGKISGGSTYLWEVANPQAKIDISRKRLIAKEAFCLASIETLCSYNSKKDVELIINAIENSDDPTIVLHGLYYLYDLDSKICLDLIDKYIDTRTSDEDKLLLLDIRFQLKEPDRVDWVINFLANYIADGNDKYYIIDKAKKMLFGINIDESHIVYIREILETGSVVNKHAFYQIITYHKILSFASFFIEILKNSDDPYEINLLLKYFNHIGVEDDFKSIYESILVRLYEEYKTDIASVPYPEIVLSFKNNNISNSILADLLTSFDEDLSIFNEMTSMNHDPFIKDKRTKKMIIEQHKQEQRIFNYLVTFSYFINSTIVNEIVLKLGRLSILPLFNKDEQKVALKTIFDLLNDNEIDNFISTMNLSIHDKLFIFEIIIEDRNVNDFRFKVFTELLHNFFEMGRPDDLIKIIEKFWSLDAFNRIVDELRLLEIKHRPRFDRSSILTFFNKIDSFIISKIFNNTEEIEFNKIMPLKYENDIHPVLKDIFLFWNNCYDKRKYTY